jgi:plastocyanin
MSGNIFIPQHSYWKINMKNYLAVLMGSSAAILFCIASRAANYTVTMNNDFFSPATLTIAKGDSVTWTNVTPLTSHNSKSGSSCTTNGLWATSSDVAAHGFVTFTFTNLPAPSTNPYFCSIHCAFGMVGTLIVTNGGNVPPSVSITNPVAGAKFKAPASLALMANATDQDGSVTNVQFFSGNTLLGNVTAAPFNFQLNNLPAGNYSFTAAAFDNTGAGMTSSVVNIFVLTNATLVSPVLTNGQFLLTIQGIANQTYTTEASSNLMNWFPLTTNVAPANNFNVLDSSATNAPVRFYRVRQDF